MQSTFAGLLLTRYEDKSTNVYRPGGMRLGGRVKPPVSLVTSAVTCRCRMKPSRGLIGLHQQRRFAIRVSAISRHGIFPPPVDPVRGRVLLHRPKIPYIDSSGSSQPRTERQPSHRFLSGRGRVVITLVQPLTMAVGSVLITGYVRRPSPMLLWMFGSPDGRSGTGYIGSFTAVSLLEAGYKVVLTDNLYNSSTVALDRIELICGKRPAFFRCDVTDEASIDQIFDAHPDIDSVIHFAALKVWRDEPRARLEGIVDRRLTCEAGGGGIRRDPAGILPSERLRDHLSAPSDDSSRRHQHCLLVIGDRLR